MLCYEKRTSSISVSVYYYGNKKNLLQIKNSLYPLFMVLHRFFGVFVFGRHLEFRIYIKQNFQNETKRKKKVLLPPSHIIII